MKVVKLFVMRVCKVIPRQRVEEIIFACYILLVGYLLYCTCAVFNI